MNAATITVTENEDGSWNYEAVGVRHVADVPEIEWDAKADEYRALGLTQQQIEDAASNVDWCIRRHGDTRDPIEIFEASLEGVRA